MGCKGLILGAAFLFAIFLANAQDWYPATVVLKNDNIMRGEISFWSGRDAIFLSAGETEMVIPAHRVQSLVYWDADMGVPRRFVAMPNSRGAATMFEFYEVLVDGPISVLRQQHLFWYSLRLQTSDYDYFIVKDGALMPFHHFRKHVYPDLKKSSSALREYASKKKLSLSDIDETISIIRYYNDEQTGIASAR